MTPLCNTFPATMPIRDFADINSSVDLFKKFKLAGQSCRDTLIFSEFEIVLCFRLF